MTVEELLKDAGVGGEVGMKKIPLLFEKEKGWGRKKKYLKCIYCIQLLIDIFRNSDFA